MLVKRVVVEKANRLYQVPPEVDSLLRLTRKRERTHPRKGDLIDLATFTWPVSELDLDSGSADFTASSHDQLQDLKVRAAEWVQKRSGIRIDPDKEIFIGAGISQMAILLSLAFIDHGDVGFVPELGLPLYRRAVAACGGETVSYGINSRDGWSIGLDRLNTGLGRVARLMFINSPHNPTGLALDSGNLDELVWMASRSHVALINDAAYADLSEPRTPSLMSATGAKKVGVELYSFAYNFGLPSVPLGFMAGHRDIINGVKQAARLLPPYLPASLVAAASRAIENYPQPTLLTVRDGVSQARESISPLLEKLNLQPVGEPNIPFAWAKVDPRSDATRTVDRIYRRWRIQTIPGTVFGDIGEQFVRLSLTVTPDTIDQALTRLNKRPPRRKRRTS
ncbi:aminotransferase class I/II-fold pyridoxal phosphate-dependent enzyme [candidate division GN15 bacterium]|nr:aminotransferase class I/II-fold pyridoxal phosphate-dependent enzyme [candidate division GN15 bacterium]